MITKIVEQLKTGSIKNVYAFGQITTTPEAPYIIVKPEAVQDLRNFRIFVHYPPAYNLDIEDYVFNELSDLLKNFQATDRYGNTVTVKDNESYTDLVTDNDDKTISMERTFYVPFRLH